MRTDRQTDITKLRVAFSNFANASESAEEVSTAVDSTSFNGDRVGQLNISRTAQGRNWVGTPTGVPYKMSKWKWLVVNIYECDRLDLYRYGNFKLLAKCGRCLGLGLGVVLRINCAAATLTAFSFVETCGLTSKDLANLSQHPSHTRHLSWQ